MEVKTHAKPSPLFIEGVTFYVEHGLLHINGVAVRRDSISKLITWLRTYALEEGIELE